MKSRIANFWLLLTLIAVVVSACGGNAATQPSASTATPTNPPGQVVPTTISVPDPIEATSAYLNAWGDYDYATMYAMLTQLSADGVSYEDFAARYVNVEVEASLAGVEYEILGALTNPNNAQVAYSITLNSSLVGAITRETRMNLSLENGAWKVIWNETLILPELAGGNRLSMQRFTPTRGLIYDQFGNALVAAGEVVALSVIPSNVNEEGVSGLLAQLARMTGYPSGYLNTLIFGDDAPYIVPVAEMPVDQFEAYETYLDPYLGALSWQNYFTRLYYIGSGGANTLGYVGQIPAEEVDEWARLGYPVDAFVGRLGIENWGEEYLAGQRGGELYVVSPNDERVTILGSREAQPSESIYTTLDAELQFWAQFAIKDFTGAIVVLERDTGRILAMASSPTFDPNDADFANPNSEWGSYFTGDLDRPFFNRATQGEYVPGSIFKVITIAAALESGLYTPQSSLYCGHEWTGLGTPLKDWTLDKGLPASGELTLQEGIMRSCNPWFYTIGQTLYSQGQTTLLADMARAFGLGSVTGLDVLPESEGLISNPDNSTTESQPLFNAVQQAIGQSDTLITPLQAAVYIAAIGNGGIIYQPQLIQEIVDTGGEANASFVPIEKGTLPISEDTLRAIQGALRMVTTNPRGTAYRTFANLTIPVYGKTGTAEITGLDPHAWFIGYTNAARADKPDIAIAVLVENIGDGSEFAAPIFRRVMEVYFYGAPQRPYPWEDGIGVFNLDYFFPPVEDDAAGDNGGGNDDAVEVTPSP